MLYRLLKNSINEGIKNKNLDKEDMQTKLDVFLAKDRITLEQYNELCALLDSYTEA